MKIDILQHENSIWTWNSKNSTRVSLWIPYVQSIIKIKKDNWLITYNGGEVEFITREIDFILFYGDCGDLPIEFLDSLRRHKVCIIIHRRNISEPIVFYAPIPNDNHDVLTKQILFRENQIKRTYIAKKVIYERLKQFEKFGVSIPKSTYKKLNNTRNIKQIRAIESQETKKYWKKYYHSLGVEISRREKHIINDALNAGSMFIMGIILRWILFHKLSPSHGYMHEVTSYPALVYDLMEPYRHLIEKSVAKSYNSLTDDEISENKNITGKSLSGLKSELEKAIYCPATMQTVRAKNLLHGVVLALRAYLIGDMKNFVVPTANIKKGGRPIKTTYKMPGQIWQK